MALPPIGSTGPSRPWNVGNMTRDNAPSRNIDPGMIARISGAMRQWLGMQAGPGSPELPFFPPGKPLDPLAQGAAGRRFDYPTSYNTLTRPRSYEPVDFDVLRALADPSVGGYDLLRLAIETRKDQCSKLVHSILPRKQANETTRGKADDRCRQLEELFLRPDGETPWQQWSSQLIEEHLVIDAPAILRKQDMGGRTVGIELIDGACYSDDTEVLTRRGWLRFSEVDIESDEFATRHQATKAFVWQKATYFHEVDYVGPLYHFHSRAVDLLVSPNHRMLVDRMPRSLGGNSHRESGEVIVTAAALAASSTQHPRIPMTSVWQGTPIADKVFEQETGEPHPRLHRDVPRRQRKAPSRVDFICEECTQPVSRFASQSGAARFCSVQCHHRNHSRVRMSGDDYCAFMGMYLAEGSCTVSDDKTINVTQMPKSRGFKPYQALIKRIWGGVLHTGTNFLITSRPLRAILHPLGHALDKRIPAEIMEATPAQLRIFWDHFRVGDGCADRDRLYTSSPIMADQLIEIAQKLGLSASLFRRVSVADKKFANGHTIAAENCSPNYVVSVRTSETMGVSIATEMYSGKIRCVSVPNEILYVRRNGKPAWCANTIKPLLNYDGRRPTQGAAYQQILKGIPAVDYTRDQLLYAPRNPRVNKVYGMSCVEQVLVTVNIGLRRQAGQLAFYTEGNIPDAVSSVPASWGVAQIKEYQDYWDTMVNDAVTRRKMRFIPDGTHFQLTRDQGALVDQFDEWLARVIAYCFSLPPTPFVRMMNRATAESAYEEALSEGLQPLMVWLKGILDYIIANWFGWPDIEVVWDDIKKTDPAEKEQRDLVLVEKGVISADDMRAERGLEPFGIPAIVYGIGPLGFMSVDAIKQAIANGWDLSGMPQAPAPGMGGDLGAIPGAAGVPGADQSDPLSGLPPEILQALGVDPGDGAAAGDAGAPGMAQRESQAANSPIPGNDGGAAVSGNNVVPLHRHPGVTAALQHGDQLARRMAAGMKGAGRR